MEAKLEIFEVYPPSILFLTNILSFRYSKSKRGSYNNIID